MKTQKRPVAGKLKQTRNWPLHSQEKIISDMIVLKNKKMVDWYTPAGASVKKKEIISKGFPEIRGGKFVTFTVDRELFDSPQEAYEVCTDHFRRMTEKMRSKYGYFRWCRKLELHADGYPHWHCIFLIKRKIDIPFLSDCWGFCPDQGIDLELIKGDNLDYLFKYIAKVGCDGGLPEWVLDYPKQIRFWQCSQGKSRFYTKEDTKKRGEKKTYEYTMPDGSVVVLDSRFSLLAKTIRQRMERKKYLLEIMKMKGDRVLYRKTVKLNRPYKEMMSDLVREWKIWPTHFKFYEHVVRVNINNIIRNIDTCLQKQARQLTQGLSSGIASLESW